MAACRHGAVVCNCCDADVYSRLGEVAVLLNAGNGRVACERDWMCGHLVEAPGA